MAARKSKSRGKGDAPAGDDIADVSAGALATPMPDDVADAIEAVGGAKPEEQEPSASDELDEDDAKVIRELQKANRPTGNEKPKFAPETVAGKVLFVHVPLKVHREDGSRHRLGVGDTVPKGWIPKQRLEQLVRGRVLSTKRPKAGVRRVSLAG